MIDNELQDTFEFSTEAEIERKELKAPRVTLSQIDELMNQVQYTVIPTGTTDTIVIAKLNGFTLAIGFSACVSPENFDE